MPNLQPGGLHRVHRNALRREPLPQAAHLRRVAVDPAILRALREHRDAAANPDHVLRSGNAGQVIAERFERRDGLVHAAHVELFLKILVGPLHVPAHPVELRLCFGLGLRVLLRVVVDIFVDGIVEVFGFHQLAPHQLVCRDRLHVELDVLLGEPRAQRFEIVGEVVEDPEVRSQGIHATRVLGASARRYCITCALTATWSSGSVLSVSMTMAVTLRAGPGEYSGRLVKMPGAIDSRFGSTAPGPNARSLESEEGDRLWLPVLHDRDLVLVEIGDGLGLADPSRQS